MIPLSEDAAMAGALLASAYRRIHHSGWPESIVSSLKHPIYSRLLLLAVQHPDDSQGGPVMKREALIRPDPPPDSDRVSQHVAKHGFVADTKLDRKRLASGERDDD